MHLTLDKVGKSYGARRVLSGVTRTVRGGECLAIVGANGSGKSTLLKIIAGMLRPTRGEISFGVNGIILTDANDRRRLVGYCAPDLSFYPELSGTENLRFFAEVRGESVREGEMESRLNAVGLAGRGGDPVSSYSSGMKQRLRLAFACRNGDVPFLLLDEPSLALDSGGVALVKQIISRQKTRGAITLIATNDSREAAWADSSISVEIEK
ncbi:MAG: ABC transporter ATP-binding protein [Akkermansiaceae bacterium]|nr:ABC transporter ATP-binding protein [Armatimonadota bacterium]